ncbi:hypothetical protein [Actinoplanes sp. N902-109]|uniref:hypothetical protein n=1 Tax=Actinoplanes sp. (strain N902-109) TaxID=649831 RepID=UPI0003294B4D|nr:hypothetical protein [Actinoplanes sp. N902-109]AGL15326.1 hypothetical protein L083_1816 [Actinoplanes sp. N902-109]
MPTSSTVEEAVLRRGFHPHPRRGACLLELVSTLPGGPWTDRPRGVPPLLAVVCRSVNDRLSDAARSGILPAVPWLAALPAAAGRDPDALFGGLLEAAARWAGAAVWALPRDRPRARVLRRAVRQVAELPGADAALQQLLFDAIDVTRTGCGLPPVPWSSQPSVAGPGGTVGLRMRAETRCPDDSLSTYLWCGAELQQWPGALRQAWADARPAA